MAIVQGIDLSKFTAAGVYTIYNDATVQAAIASNPVIKLIPGFSKSGVFNTGVLIDQGDYSTAEALYGKIDKTLERRGSFFHRSLRIGLETGACIALNLLKLNNEYEDGAPTENADVIPYRSLSVDMGSANGINRNKLYSSFFNKERFWFADPNYLLATRDVVDDKSLINFVNVSQTPLTVIVKKSDIAGFDATVKDWYADAQEEIPAYLKEDDLVSDYFIDVVVVNGNFGPDKFPQLSVDPVFGKYFGVDGLRAELLEEFIALPEVITRQTFTGTIIPNFRDKKNVQWYIQDVVNRRVNTIGILCAVDRKELDNFELGTNTKEVDLVGHSLIGGGITSVDFLSYKKRITQDFAYTEKTTNASETVDLTTGVTINASVPGVLTVSVNNTNPDFATFNSDLEIGLYFEGVTTAAGTAAGVPVANPVLQVTKVLKTTSLITFDLKSPLKDGETPTSGSFVDIDITGGVAETLADANFAITAAGGGGDVVEARVDEGSGPIVIGTFTLVGGESAADIVDGLISDITANSGTHGYTVLADNGDDFDVSAPVGSGTSANAYTTDFNITGTTTGTSDATFANGVDAIAGVVDFETENDRFFLDGTDTFYLADTLSQAHIDWKAGQLTNGDKISDGTDTFYLKFEIVPAIGGIDIADNYKNLLKISLFTDSDLTLPISVGAAVAFGDSVDSLGFPVADPTKLNFSSLVGSINERVGAEVVEDKIVRIPVADASKFSIGNYLVGFDGDNNEILTRILEIRNEGSPTVTHILVETANIIKTFTSPAGGTQVERFLDFTVFVDRFSPTYLKGFTMKESHIPDGSNDRMKEIYQVINNTNLFDAITDPDFITFRYFVDTFNGGLETQSKRYLAQICKARQKCLGLLNTPSISEFQNSVDPRFTETPTAVDPLPVLNTKYIRDGGNLAENPSFKYTLPEETDGASFVGFFSPNIIVRDEDGEELSVPPAAYVSNNYTRKYLDGSQFLPTAGRKRGNITGDGLLRPEYPYFKNDRGYLFEKGINPIRVDGDSLQIYGNETAYTKFRSALNNLNVRDSLITFEIDTENILKNYNFEYNSDSIRSEVTALLTNYYEPLKNNFGAIKSYDFIFDSSNNTEELVRENIGLVDVKVEFPDILRVFINRVTIFRSAAPSSGGFVAV